LFTVFLGEIEEHQEAFAPLDVTRVQGPGQERAWAQLKLQHKADQHAHLHFKQVAEKISKLAQVHNFDRLILAGPVEATSELERLLPKALRTRLVDVLALPVDANEAQVLQETTRIENEIERKREAELVESLITAAAKHQPAVVGLDEILIALQEWRIGQLIYADGYHAPGGQCTNCEALLAESSEPCTYCGSSVRELYDLVAVAHERVLHLNQKVEQVSGEAAKRMHEVGDIGAFLRY
jgi:peptide chain release factor subunit 1